MVLVLTDNPSHPCGRWWSELFPFPWDSTASGRISCSFNWIYVYLQLESEKWFYVCIFTPWELASHNGLALVKNLSHAFHVFWVYCNFMSRARLFKLATYCIATREYFEEGLSFSRRTWRHIDTNIYKEAHMLDLEIPQHLEADIYYTIWSDIWGNNQRSCNNLKLEKNLGTQSWYQRVNLRIFSVSVVETYNVATQYMAYEDNSHIFFCALTEEIIDNDIWIQ